MSKQYFTVKNYAASDLVGSLSSRTGTDDEGVQWAFVKFATGNVTRIPPEVAEAFIVLGDEPGE